MKTWLSSSIHDNRERRSEILSQVKWIYMNTIDLCSGENEKDLRYDYLNIARVKDLGSRRHQPRAGVGRPALVNNILRS